jgi:methionyl-tRNA formyltransferase
VEYSLRVLFFGTPEFAVPSLERLIQSSHAVVGVVTSRDKPRGRGLKLLPVPVKAAALKFGLPVLEPPNMKAESFLEQVKALSPDVLVVVAFRILPRVLFAIPRYGAINVHPSLLPKYRGPAPIHWTLIQGEKVTGVTTFQIGEQVDAGNLLLQREMSISEDDDFGSLHDRLAVLGAELLLETLDGLENGSLTGKPQDNSGATPAPKVQPEDAAIDWRQSAVEIRNRVRAFSPFPGAWTFLERRTFKIYRCDEAPVSEDAVKNVQCPTQCPTPGLVDEISKDGFPMVGTGDRWLILRVVQMEGKKRMPADAFVRGFPLLGKSLETPVEG